MDGDAASQRPTAWVEVSAGVGAAFSNPSEFANKRRSVAVDLNGNVYVVGRIASGGAMQMVTVAYDTRGMQRWRRVRSAAVAASGGGAEAVAVDAAGNIYVVGFVTDQPLNASAIIISYDGSGHFRSALNEALTKLFMPLRVPANTAAFGATIRAADINEIRNAVKSLPRKCLSWSACEKLIMACVSAPHFVASVGSRQPLHNAK